MSSSGERGRWASRSVWKTSRMASFTYCGASEALHTTGLTKASTAWIESASDIVVNPPPRAHPIGVPAGLGSIPAIRTDHHEGAHTYLCAERRRGKRTTGHRTHDYLAHHHPRMQAVEPTYGARHVF